jgi:4-amino-4-deoxy-L-arabinose transferase-like glycosyltransferase
MKTIPFVFNGPDVNLGRFGSITKGIILPADANEARDLMRDKRFTKSAKPFEPYVFTPTPAPEKENEAAKSARLYADVVTDKPPGASLFYAAVFALLGRSMKAVHAAAIVWNFATSVVVYLIAARFYNKRIALWAALFFVYFSTNYFTQDMMAANTELLMALPYTAAFYVFMLGNTRSGLKGGGTRVVVPHTAGALIAAGLLTGLATLFKQIGVLNLIFFAVYEIFTAWSAHHSREQTTTTWATSMRTLFARLALVAVGFVLVVAWLVVWLKSQGALGDFWRNGIVLNMFYIDSEPLGLWIKFSGRGFGFVFFNATLWSFAILAVSTSRSRRSRSALACRNSIHNFRR